MPEPLESNGDQRLRLCDESGRTIGVFLSAEMLERLNAERDRLRAEVAELQRALDAARQEVRDKAAITAERDLYLHELEAFWAEKIADMDQNGLEMGEVIAEIERDLRGRGMRDAE